MFYNNKFAKKLIGIFTVVIDETLIFFISFMNVWRIFYIVEFSNTILRYIICLEAQM